MPARIRHVQFQRSRARIFCQSATKVPETIERYQGRHDERHEIELQMSYSLQVDRDHVGELLCLSKIMKTICWMASIIFIGLHGMSLMARAQEADERGRRPASSREILAVSSISSER